MFPLVIVLVLFLVIGVFTWFYLVNIYEVKILVNPKSLVANIDSKIEIKAIPLNSFGSKALFRKISVEYEILQGGDLVKIMKNAEGSIVLQSLSKNGKVEILVTPEYGLFPSKIIFTIKEKM